MDELCKRLEEAVVCANDVQFHPEAVKSRNDAISFINNIRSDPSNWKVAFQTFLMTTNFRVMFTCLDIVISFIREGSYQQVSSEEKNYLHTSLLGWLCGKSADYINNIPDYLKTKYSVLVALVIKVDYPQYWSDAFDSLMNIRSYSSCHLLMYLKILYYIDEEVVQGVGGKRAPSDRENLQAGTRVKDSLRDSSIGLIFNSWMEVLQQYGNQNDAMSVTLCNTCLETLSGYADWIDVSFMTNSMTLQILFGLLENENYAENVLLCFEELINKGMPVQNKIRLIHSLTICSVLGSLITSGKYTDNIDVMIEILDVLMIIVKEIVEAFPDCVNLPDCMELFQYIREDFSTIFSILPTVLHNEYLNPIISISDLLTKIAIQIQREAEMEKKNDSSYLSLNLKQYLRMLLEGIFCQMRLPEDYSFDPESGIDSDTDMYRNSLKKVLISLIKLYPDVYLDFLNYLFAEVTPFDHFQVAEWRDAEAALSYVYFFGEGCNVNYQQSKYRDIFIGILTSLIESNVIQHHYHHSVLLVGMDIISRYQVLLIPIQSLHYHCLSVFMQGLNSNRNRIREKAVNLLSRFVAAMKEAIVPFQQGILEAVQRMIVIPTPQDCMRYSSEPNYFEPIYPLFYITSSIISGNWNQLPDIYGFYHNAFMTLFENINNARQQLTNSDTDQYVLNSIGYNIGCIANMLKGICNNTASALTSLEGDMKNEVVCLLRLYLDTYPLTVSSHGSYLLYQLDGLIHRLVIVLKEDILAYTADICQLFSSLHSYRAMETCYSIINQIYASYKSKQDMYLDPLLYHLTECCCQDYEGDEEVIGKKQNMVCEYYDLLDTVITYSPQLLYSQHNGRYLTLYLSALHQGLTTSVNMPVTKLCICCYRKLANVWFDATVNVPEEVRTMLANHLISEVIPFLFQMYQLPQFNINDSGTITAINEVAALLFILDNNRPDFDQFFFNVFLPSNGCTPEICGDFRKCFQQKRNDLACTYLRSFFKQLVRQ